ncbi:hypothetical protein VPH35_114210 [Triticum aestivum]
MGIPFQLQSQQVKVQGCRACGLLTFTSAAASASPAAPLPLRSMCLSCQGARTDARSGWLLLRPAAEDAS